MAKSEHRIQPVFAPSPNVGSNRNRLAGAPITLVVASAEPIAVGGTK